MRIAGFFVVAVLGAGLLATSSAATPDGWHTSLKDGVAAAEKSRKPIFMITAWKRTL